MRKKLRKELNQSTDIKEKQHLKDRIGIMKEHIVDKNKEIRGIKVKKIVERIRSNINNGAKIWEIKRRIEQKTKKTRVKHQLKNEEGETLKQPDEIKEEYAKYYKALLKKKQAIASEEQQAEIKVEKQFTEIMKEEINKKRERITENMVKKEINKMKRKKAGDRLGWKAEWSSRRSREIYKKDCGMKWDKKQKQEQLKMINGKGKHT